MGEDGLMRYRHAVIAAVLGAVLAGYGVIRWVNSGLCDQCWDQAASGQGWILAGLVIVVLAVVGAVVVWRRGRRLDD
jgi:hypothetical protein